MVTGQNRIQSILTTVRGMNTWSLVTLAYAAGAVIGVPTIDAEILFAGAMSAIALLTLVERLLERRVEVS